jgi:alpha-tubulin suppressor-like RCC1 family protein
VHYATSAGTATSPGDFVAVSRNVTIAAGQVSTVVTVGVRGDALVEGTETFKVTLSTPSNATLGTASATGTILDDDPGSGTRLGIGNATVVEGNSGARSVRLTVSLSAPAAGPVSAHYATSAGSASSVSDFVSASGTVTIPAGSTSALVLVSVKADTVFEFAETFVVKLSAPTGAVLARANGTATIGNDDPVPPGQPTAVVGGYDHSCALISNGTVRCWGSNELGQIGDGTTTERLTPRIVTGITSATRITAGSSHTCALLSGRTVKCWGNNANGQLGDGTTTQRNAPKTVPGLTGVVSIDAGFFHTCAVLSSGAIKCWGSNFDGKLGDGTTTQRPSPVAVVGITTATQVSAGGKLTCARLSDGAVKCWGDSEYGEIGDGATTDRPTPTAVSGITSATQVSTGQFFACARLADGTLRCWGFSWDGETGDGDPSFFVNGTEHHTPVQVVGVTGAAEVALGADSACARLGSGAVWCWGSSYRGQSGRGISGAPAGNNWALAAAVPGLTSVAAIGAGVLHHCAVVTGGVVKCWGNNASGQIGDGTKTQRNTPVTVAF